jgi:hypothetical protein
MHERVLMLAAGLLSAAAAMAGPVCLERASFSTPTNRFAVEEAGIVRDTVTGLIWQRCALGQVLDDGDTSAVLEDDSCSPAPVARTWSAALEAAVEFNAQELAAGRSGEWRVPNRKELATIEELKCVFPAVNTAVFPALPSRSLLWSSTPIADAESTSVWVLDAWNGGLTTAQKGTEHLVRLVREAR